MRLAIDLDGVIAQTMPAVVKLINTAYGTSYTDEDITEYSFWKVIPELARAKKPKDLAYRYMDLAWLNPDIMIPEPGAVETIQQLYAMGIKIDIVTGRTTTPPEILKRWLAKYDIPYDKLVVVPGDQKAGMEYDVFIDDHPEFAGNMFKYPNKILLIYPQPWNRNIQTHGNVQRITGWNDPTIWKRLGFGETIHLPHSSRRPGMHIREYARRYR